LTTEPAEPVRDLLRLEYQALKEEQRSRITARDRLVYATLAVLVATVAAGTDRPVILLLLPAVCATLGWTYLVNDAKVTAIGHYIRTELTPRLASTLHAGGVEILGWELARGFDGRRRARKLLQLGANLATFVVPSLVALAQFWLSGSPPVQLLIASALEFAAVTVLGVQLVRYADLSR